MGSDVRRRCGFTLIELIVIISMIGLLVAIALPAVQSARETARRIRCASNLHNLGLALQQRVERLGTLPPGSGPEKGESYFVHLLPCFDQMNLYNSKI